MLVLLYLTHYVKMCSRCSLLPSHSLLESAHSFSSVSISVYKSFKLSFLAHSLAFLLAKTRSCRYNKEKTTCAECTSRRSKQTMEEKRWESCNAEALLEEFFSQDDLRQLALSTGELLDCPLLVLDDTFHIAAHHRRSAFPMRSLKPPCAAARSPMRPAQSSAKMRCSQLVGRTMSSCRKAPTGGVLRRSSARACASAA